MFVDQLQQLQPKILSSGRTRSEAGRHAKRKGKIGERNVADFLKEISGEPFLRIPSSGAFIGKSNRDRILMYREEQVDAMLGDIFPPPNLLYRFIIESKFYKDFAFKKLQKNEAPAKLIEWIGENCYDTVTYLSAHFSREPLPFLVFRITRQGEYIVYNKKYFEKIVKVFNPQFNIKYTPNQELIDIGFGDEWYIEDFKTFITNNQKELFKGNF